MVNPISNVNNTGTFRTMGNPKINYRPTNKQLEDVYERKAANKNKKDVGGIIAKGLAVAGALVLTYKGHGKIEKLLADIKTKSGSFIQSHRNLSLKGLGACAKSIGSSVANAAKSVWKMFPEAGKAIINVFKKTPTP